jgi:hypothetical protein
MMTTAAGARVGGVLRPGHEKPLLSVEESAILLGERREVIYASIRRGDFPLPVFTINGRLRIARRSVERLIDGRLAPEDDDSPTDQDWSDAAGRSSRRRPTCSAARLSSTLTESV